MHNHAGCFAIRTRKARPLGRITLLGGVNQKVRFWEVAQASDNLQLSYLNGKLQQREIGRLPLAAAISQSQYLCRQPRLQEQKYVNML